MRLLPTGFRAGYLTTHNPDSIITTDALFPHLMKLSRSDIFAVILMLPATVQPAQAWTSDQEWQLVFNDEFSSASFTEDGTIDTSAGTWNELGYVSWGVADWRKYQSTDDALVQQGESNGTDYVSLKGAYGDYTSQSDQTGENDTYACGGIFTNKTFSFQYGYVEVRAQFDCVQGCWPAIWLMPVSDSGLGGWPASGEIDILEHLNAQAKIWQTLHLTANSGSGDAAPSVQPTLSDTTGWHTYGVEWTEDAITFYLDGTATQTFNKSDYTYWPFSTENHEFYLLIDQQIGGSWVEGLGTGGIDTDTLSTSGADFNIDYVRVYSYADNNAAAGGWNGTPTDAEGNDIEYVTLTDMTAGNLDVSEAGDYLFNVTGTVTHMLAEGSDVQLQAAGGSTTALDNAMMQADSLYISDGRFKMTGSATLDVDTLYVAGGSLEVDFEYALTGVKQIYLGYESDVIGVNADRNSALYFTENQVLTADVTLVDDSKISVFNTKTLKFSGNISAENNTLVLTGVGSSAAATVQLAGGENKFAALWLCVDNSTDSEGNTFRGPGQKLAVEFLDGSNTTVEELRTNAQTATTGSSFTVQNGAVLTVLDNWSHGNNAYNATVASGGVFNIGNGTQGATATTLSGVNLTVKGNLNVNAGSEFAIDSLTVSATGNSSSKANLNIAAGSTVTIGTLNMDGDGWQSIGTLNVADGDTTTIATLVTGSNGQVDVNVESGTLKLQTLTVSSNQAIVLQAESRAQGTVNITDNVNLSGSDYKLHTRFGRVEFDGGISGTGRLELNNSSTAKITGSAGAAAINVAENAVLETAGNFSGGTISGTGTVVTVAGEATIATAANGFTGSVKAAGGNMTVSGSATYDRAEADNGYSVNFVDMSDGLTIQTLVINKGSIVGAYVNTELTALNEATITVTGALQAGYGTLNADIVLAAGSTLNITDARGLTMGSSITLQGGNTIAEKITLGTDIVAALTSPDFVSYTLATSMDGFYTFDYESGSVFWADGQSAVASDYFTAEGVNLNRYLLQYVWEDSTDSASGKLMIVIPEPTTATLSLLALAALSARRRRR